ncbi:MAG: hypothetical protein HQM11_21315, partial [SAR324 cluster bacterium]|nr:hypothetical protein [SAR324 cluster bacterium]
MKRATGFSIIFVLCIMVFMVTGCAEQELEEISISEQDVVDYQEPVDISLDKNKITLDNRSSVLSASQSGNEWVTYALPSAERLELSPYPGNLNKIWTFSVPESAAMIKVHFNILETEKNYDYVYILDQNNAVVTTYNGAMGNDVWSIAVPGNTLKVKVTSDWLTSGKIILDQISYIPAVGTVQNQNIPHALESLHPYLHSVDYTETITIPNAKTVQIHFTRMGFEKSYDWLYIYDGQDREIGKYTGSYTDLWTMPIYGNIVKIRLKSDRSLNDYGFMVDQVNVILNSDSSNPPSSSIISVNAAVSPVKNQVMLFAGQQTLEYDVVQNMSVKKSLKQIDSKWSGVWAEGVDAAVNMNNGKLYFFKGTQYLRYDIATDRTDTGYPKPIAGNWPGLWNDSIDEAINMNNGKLYFFRGSQYLRYDIATDRTDTGYPKPIAGNWPGLWSENIDAAVNMGNGKLYFFKAGELIQYDIALDRADQGYPVAMQENWKDAADPATPEVEIVFEGTTDAEGIWKGVRDMSPVNPKLSWTYFNNTDHKLYVWNGSQWQTSGNSAIPSGWAGIGDVFPTGPGLFDYFYKRTKAEGNYYQWDGQNWVVTENKNEIRDLHVVYQDSLSFKVSWTEPEAHAEYYLIWHSTDGIVFDHSFLTSRTEIKFSGMKEHSPHYFVVVPVLSNDTGTPSEMAGTLTGVHADRRLLIVNGFDRNDSQVTLNARNYIIPYLQAVAHANRNWKVDFASNEAVSHQRVALKSYDGVIWYTGRESQKDQTFADTVASGYVKSEQDYITDYLYSGGNLFVSGTEIAWDLDLNGPSYNVASANDDTFLKNMFKVKYEADDKEGSSSAIKPSTHQLFKGIDNFNLDADGSVTYAALWPDRIYGHGGGEPVLDYTTGKTGWAASAYKKEFTVLFFGFPFETIVQENARNTVMDRILGYFEEGNLTSTEISCLDCPERFWQYANHTTIYPGTITISGDMSFGYFDPSDSSYPSRTNYHRGMDIYSPYNSPIYSITNATYVGGRNSCVGQDDCSNYISTK